MSLKQLITALVVVALVVPCASAVLSETDATSANPEITDSGFVMEKNAFFYFAKFMVGGIAFTGGSASKDTPTAGFGKTMNDNSVFASIGNMDQAKQYYLTISEYSGDTLNYGLKVKLEAEKVSTFVYMSVIDAVAYSNGAALTSEIVKGAANESFSQTDFSAIEYRFVLSEGDSTEAISEDVVKNPDKYSYISVAKLRTSGVEDEIADLGKIYGYLTEKDNAHYAGKVISVAPGDYYCIFYMSNIDASDLEVKISDGKEYVVPTELIKTADKTVIANHYYYSAIPVENLREAGIDSDLSDAKVTLGTDGVVYAELSAASDSDGSDDADNNTTIIAAVAAVLIVVVLIVVFVKSRGA